MYKSITEQTARALGELLEAAGLGANTLLVTGCSTSEIAGSRIGTAGSLAAANAVLDGLLPLLNRRGVYLAVQCCEHLNRALVLPGAALTPHMQRVNVLPQPHAGGSLAAAYWARCDAPVAVEHLCADAGLDIGQTLIGMHLKAVAVPVRLTQSRIGQAVVAAARTRPKYIGGARAAYDAALE